MTQRVLRTRAFSAGILIAMGSALAGCQLFSDRKAELQSFSEIREPLPHDYGVQLVSEGRDALAEGRVMDAIDSFQIAKYYPEQAPAAYNGLAVAYSRVGRTDLTERFFAMAVSLAPQDDRYRANLALFHSRNGIPPATTATPELAAGLEDLDFSEETEVGKLAARPAPAVQVLARGVTAQAPVSRLTRVSRNEVLVGSADGANKVHQANLRRRPVIHVGKSTYPLRMALPRSQPVEADRILPKNVRVGFRTPS